MTDYKKYINALRKCAKEHESDVTFTGHIIVADLCRDTANLLEALEQEPRKDGVILTHKEYNELIANEYNAGYRKGYDKGYCKGYVIASEEQKPVIDKIRAEIEQLPTNTRINWDGCCPDIDYPEIEYVDVSKAGLLEIIDKYKAESEEN